MTVEYSDRLPICVYGTLRPGHGNARLWAGDATARHDGDVIILGHALVTNGGFPYAVPAASSQSIGCLIVPEPAMYDVVLARMDSLEGFTPGSAHNHYERRAISVLTPDGPVRAWMYVAAWTHPNLPEVTLVEGRHDWNAHPRRSIYT